jgi:hypothetical protein
MLEVRRSETEELQLLFTRAGFGDRKRLWEG